MSENKYLQWFTAHERLVLVLAVIAFGAFCTLKAYDLVLKHDQVQAQIAHEQSIAAAQKASKDEATSTGLLLVVADLKQQLIAANQRIDQQMQQRAKQTEQQKQTNDQSTPNQLAVYISKQLGVGNVSVSQPLGDVVFDLPAAHKDADMLADLGQAQLDVKDLNTKLVGCQNLADKQADTITALDTTVQSKNDALKTEQNSHQKDIKELKDRNRKSWLNGFKWGVITGVVGSLFIHK